jgi:hypothetical protein
MGDRRTAAARLSSASREAPRGDWRLRARTGWVACELALLAGSPERAATHARASLVASRAAGARRHEAKSLLFLGVALQAAGDSRFEGALRGARTIAARIGAHPVASVARTALARR